MGLSRRASDFPFAGTGLPGCCWRRACCQRAAPGCWRVWAGSCPSSFQERCPSPSPQHTPARSAAWLPRVGWVGQRVGESATRLQAGAVGWGCNPGGGHATLPLIKDTSCLSPQATERLACTCGAWRTRGGCSRRRRWARSCQSGSRHSTCRWGRHACAVVWHAKEDGGVCVCFFSRVLEGVLPVTCVGR